MNKKRTAAPAVKITVISLLIATCGVALQIIAGHPYPAIPPVFFILLVPAALLSFTSKRWTPFSAVAAGMFLTAGLFLSGSSYRLVHFQNIGDSVGLWIQSLAVATALAGSCVAVYRNYRSPRVRMRNLEN